ncbi:hypothetical protein JR316_0003414 [Psilocybe cubensis]|uniref:Zn(2)-C6 fungal-type domain-containing protein n=2 Tax=Psilocybe cubensis TaxID=181762 RepID=A0A8H7Y554_PSICU|nr:hypothetical protein JR316_0003414 [Psilocybe cubensis]KAH9483936.1 hypothetical protein JR316_0003414 [Psilocybe cubensis]
MFFQKDASPRNGDSDFQNAVIGVDLRQSKHSDSGVTPSDHSWRTEGSELSREYSTGTSPDSHESNKETPSPKSPSHQLHSVKPQPSGRQRTSQACDKCRERKTKCSGHRPVCLRCTNRGLICEYTMRESRSRTPARSRVAVVSEIPQADYAGQGRPTPAHHSRNGGGRTNAFAPPTRSYTGTPATQTTSRPLLPNPSANSTTEPTVRNISVQQSHRPYQPRQLPDTSTSNPYSGHAPVASPNASYDTKGAWSLYDSSFDLNYSFELPSGDNDLFQPSHHSSSGHDERQTMHSALASISLPQSSLRFDYDLSR